MNETVIIEVQSGKALKDGTLCQLLEDGKPWIMPKRTEARHPDLINAMALLDAHCAARTPYLTREGDIKSKQMKFENKETGKTEKWIRPVFTDKQMADDIHCTGFFVNDKGAVGMHFTVQQEGKSSTGINVKPISLVEGDLFDTYEYLEDLRRVLKLVQYEFEQYAKHDKVDPRSKPESTGDENVPSVEQPVTGIKGVGGKKDDTDLTNYQDVDVTKRLADMDALRENNKKGGKQTPDNPAGK